MVQHKFASLGINQMEKKYILNQETAARKIKRLAYEIAEGNYGESELYFAGIRHSGFALAALLKQELSAISHVTVHLVSVLMDKRHPVEIKLEPSFDFNGKTIVLIDDVANSGKTMLYALKPFLNDYPAKIQTLVLVERTHKTFPIQPDYVGLSVATTLEEHIYVEMNEGVITGAYMD
jgi:pyrimidine operon attenuation protein/uracil phosphoribosyltransferase